MRKWFDLIAAATLILAVLAAPACDGLPPPIVQSTAEAITKLESEGEITPAQAQAMREALAELAEGVTFEDVLEKLGTIAGAVVLSILGIQRVRGPAKPMDPTSVAILQAIIEEKRRGLPQNSPTPATG